MCLSNGGGGGGGKGGIRNWKGVLCKEVLGMGMLGYGGKCSEI